MSPRSFKTVEILLVEDAAEDVDLVKEALDAAKFPHHLNVVNNGQDAVLCLKKMSRTQSPLPEVIIMDLNLPRKSGVDALREIKRDDQLKNIPVIIFTTSQCSEDILEKNSIDFRCYIKKSADFHELVDALQKLYPGVAL